MNSNRNKISTVIKAPLLIAVSIYMGLAVADFHLWQLSEIFTNAEGDIQYVELQTSATGQNNLAGQSLVSSNGFGQQNTFTFSQSLTGETQGKKLLIATASFVQLTGLSADYILDEGFLFTEGGSLNFAGGVSTVTYIAAQLAKNGIQSMNSNLEPQLADPTNFVGLTATISVPLRGIFDAGSSVLTLPVVDIPETGLAHVSFDVNLESLQFALRDGFYIYSQGITAGNTPVQLQEGGILYIPILPIGNEIYEFNLTLVDSELVIFAEPAVLSITNIVPEPEPEPSESQQSIERGGLQYAAQCAICHGSTGLGGIGPNLRTSGFNTFAALRSKTDLTMPNTNPSACKDTGSSTCATDTANFILNEFQQ
ncbi:MAG: hypothetical protein COA96_13210 [SAR86 cluster bacterium]|uniref:Cytochrome c domain-containing protein n=1 Tax=SAR86 cluster bacterium TaxID=2030880 RepID=A0A2A5AU48_9GAMM|nr:MAG: hypothetical protein COA96_13210 [SAR86 cluster bacterium]